MKKSLRLNLAFIFFSILLLTCANGSKSKKMLPVVIKGENGDSTKIEYDLENRIHKILYEESDVRLRYGPDGKLEQIKQRGHETYNFTYKKDSIFCTYTSTIDDILNRTDTLIVNSKNQLIRRNSKNGITRPGNITYKYDDKGLLVESESSYYNFIESKYVFSSSGTTEYTYDNHNGIYSKINIEPWILAYDILNLPVSIAENCVLEVDIFGKLASYTYTYIDNQYPITMEATYYRKWQNIKERSTIVYKEIK